MADRRLAEACLRWDLTPGPVVDRRGCRVIEVSRESADPSARPLELQLHEPGAPTELLAVALRRWDGRGAQRLFAAFPASGALLVERASADDLAGHWVEEAAAVVGELCRQLHVDAVPAAPRQSRLLAAALQSPTATRIPRRLVQQALSLLAQLDDEPAVLLHGNLGSASIRARPEPAGAELGWLGIDPRPGAGPAGLDLLDFVLEEPPVGDGLRWAVRHRIDIACETAGLDPDRVRAWVFIAGCALAARQSERLDHLVPLLKALAG